jgi:hypothetical protein
VKSEVERESIAANDGCHGADSRVTARITTLFAVALVACACSAPQRTTQPSPTHAAPSAVAGTPSALQSSGVPGPSASPLALSTEPPASIAADSPTPEPADSGGSTTGGDIPDNAVFLTYHDQAHGFSIEYVEGWQVTPGSDGVVIRDKDSSETVQVIPAVSDIAGYITSTDLPQLQATPGFQMDKQDVVTINGVQVNHLVYHAPAAPDPVTGKAVPSTIGRYYMAGANGLAIVTLSTPDGVDNVDAFREMIKSFAWG